MPTIYCYSINNSNCSKRNIILHYVYNSSNGSNVSVSELERSELSADRHESEWTTGKFKNQQNLIKPYNCRFFQFPHFVDNFKNIWNDWYPLKVMSNSTKLVIDSIWIHSFWCNIRWDTMLERWLISWNIYDILNVHILVSTVHILQAWI